MYKRQALNDDWFSDDLKQLNDSKIYEHLRGHWIMEMSDVYKRQGRHYGRIEKQRSDGMGSPGKQCKKPGR